MRRLVLVVAAAFFALLPAPGATAFWQATGLGTATGAGADMPTGATPQTAVSGRSVTVSWAQNAFDGSTLGARGGGYTVRRYAEGGTTPITPATTCNTSVTGTAATLSCTESGVPYGRWTYRITPLINSFTGTEGPASAIAAIVFDAPVLDPAQAQNPAAGATNGPIALSWSAGAGAAGYNVFRRTSGGSFDYASPLNGATPLTGTTYSDTTAANGATYAYVVRAVTSGPPAAVSADSNERTATVVTRPPAPAGAVTTASGTGGAIDVTWSAVGAATGYNVYRRTSTGTFDYSAPLNGATLTTVIPYRDTTVLVGTSYYYVVRAAVGGAGGTQLESASSTSSTASSCASSYASTISGTAGLTNWFRLGEASGTVATNTVSTARNGVYGGGVLLGRAAAISCDADSAVTFDGSTGYMGAPNKTAPVTAPNTFTVETWFKATSGGGKLVGFGNARTGPSTAYDRHLYLTDGGRLTFGVYPGSVKVVTSPASYTDGAWHLAVATLGVAGMHLYVDGAEVAADTTVTTAGVMSGYWRAGYDNLASWTNQPASAFFNGSLDELAIYSTQLSATTVASHYAAGRP